MFHELTSCNKCPLADPVKEHPEGRRVEDRAIHNRQTMEATLDALAETAEAVAPN